MREVIFYELPNGYCPTKIFLDKLPEKSRDLLNLHYYLDISSVKIASDLNISSSAVRNALVKIRRILKDCINKEFKGRAYA